jgi:hypothetical protein
MIGRSRLRGCLNRTGIRLLEFAGANIFIAGARGGIGAAAVAIS